MPASLLQPRAVRAAVPAASERAAGDTDAIPEIRSIKPIQRLLSRLGYDPGPIDGQLGPKTSGAIAAYEKDKGWPTTGAPSSRLYERLVADLTPKAPVPAMTMRDAADLAERRPERSPAPPDHAAAVRETPNRPEPEIAAATTTTYRLPADHAARGGIASATVDFLDTFRGLSLYAWRRLVGARRPAVETGMANDASDERTRADRTAE